MVSPATVTHITNLNANVLIDFWSTFCFLLISLSLFLRLICIPSFRSSCRRIKRHILLVPLRASSHFISSSSFLLLLLLLSPLLSVEVRRNRRPRRNHRLLLWLRFALLLSLLHVRQVTSERNLLQLLGGEANQHVFGFEVSVDNVAHAVQVVKANEALLGQNAHQRDRDLNSQ